jgi:hypothetical protein
MTPQAETIQFFFPENSSEKPKIELIILTPGQPILFLLSTTIRKAAGVTSSLSRVSWSTSCLTAFPSASSSSRRPCRAGFTSTTSRLRVSHSQNAEAGFWQHEFDPGAKFSPRGELGTWTLYPRENVHPYVHTQGWTLFCSWSLVL